eukprot:3059392-Amphidinium_carterae.3
MAFNRACQRHPDFGCHVEHASKKNAWVNIDMIQVFSAEQETQVVLCTPSYKGSHCNVWEATCVITPQSIQHTVFLHYNGYHYNRLCVPSKEESRFLRSCAMGNDKATASCLDKDGGGATKRKAPASSPVPALMCDNPLVVDTTPSGPSVAIVEVHLK